MENIGDALRLAGFMMLFVFALSVSMALVMKGKSTAEVIIRASDKSEYYRDIEISDIDNNDRENRIVKIKDIIPVLYRYSDERYIVLFFSNDGTTPLKIYDWGTDNHNKPNLIRDNPTHTINFLNYDVEVHYAEKWIATFETRKQHVDEVVKYLQSNYRNDKFKEEVFYTKDIYLTRFTTNDNDRLRNYYDKTKALKVYINEANPDEDDPEAKETRIVVYTKVN